MQSHKVYATFLTYVTENPYLYQCISFLEVKRKINLPVWLHSQTILLIDGRDEIIGLIVDGVLPPT